MSTVVYVKPAIRAPTCACGWCPRSIRGTERRALFVVNGFVYRLCMSCDAYRRRADARHRSKLHLP